MTAAGWSVMSSSPSSSARRSRRTKYDDGSVLSTITARVRGTDDGRHEVTSRTSGAGPATTRAPLSRERVLDGAMHVADDGGLASLTIRSIAQQLGVKPMSI